MPISHTYKTIFVHIPKTGGTSITKSLGMNPFRKNRWRESFLNTLMPAASRGSQLAAQCRKSFFLSKIVSKGADYFSYRDVLYGYDGRYRLHHLPADLIKNYVPENLFADYFKFAIVRNPWERLVSEYFWRTQIRREDCGDFASFVCSLDTWYPRDQLGPSQPPFLHYCDHVHFLSQSRYIYDRDGTCLVDHIYRFETLEEDFRKLRARLGVDIRLPRNNTTRHGHYSCYYNPRTVEIVRRFYAEDIERFGYTFSA